MLETASRGNFLVLNEAVPALKELGDNLGACFLRWDGRNFGYDTHEKYIPSGQAYYEEHGEIIVNMMRMITVCWLKPGYAQNITAHGYAAIS